MPPGTPRWGAKWKQAVRDNYLSALKPGTGVHGSMYSYRDVYLDLDPTYRDRFDRPLVRITMDFHDNELKQNRFSDGQVRRDLPGDGCASRSSRNTAKDPTTSRSIRRRTFAAARSWAPIRSTSALNRYLQSWDVPNLFVMGASAFPQNAGYNPTGTVAALAYWSAQAIRTGYLKSPGPLVHT